MPKSVTKADMEVAKQAIALDNKAKEEQRGKVIFDASKRASIHDPMILVHLPDGNNFVDLAEEKK